MRRGACLLMVLFVSVSMARADEAEDRTVAFVLKLNGTYGRDPQKPGKPVVIVSLAHTKITDRGLRELANFPKLQNLNLDHTGIGDAGLEELVALKQLQVLSLFGTKVTNPGLRVLAGVKQLNRLGLGPTQINDETLQTLRKMRMLHIMQQTWTTVPDPERKDHKRPAGPEVVWGKTENKAILGFF